MTADPRPWRAGDVVRLNDGSMAVRYDRPRWPWLVVSGPLQEGEGYDEFIDAHGPVLLVRDGQPIHQDDDSDCGHSEHAKRGYERIGRRFPKDGPDVGIWETCSAGGR